MEAKTDEAKIEFRKAVTNVKAERQEENLGTIQKSIEEAAGQVEHTTKIDGDRAVKRTPEKVRTCEEGCEVNQSDLRKSAQESSKETQSRSSDKKQYDAKTEEYEKKAVVGVVCRRDDHGRQR